MTVANVKQYFPFDKVEVFHKDVGYSIKIEDAPHLIKNAEITHFAVVDGVVVAYAEG